jgi:hypothetical protein
MVFSSMIIYIVSIIFVEPYWVQIFSGLSFFLVFFAILIMWEEFFNYNEFIDFLFSKKSSQNVIGKFKPKGSMKKIILFSSHIDSALQFNLLKWLGWKAIPILFGTILVILIWFALSFINLILILIGFISLKDFFLLASLVLFFIALPCFLVTFFFVPTGDKGNVVPGSVDNLSSCSVIVGLGRYLNKNRDIIPDDTEIRLISFGCEESGLRGSYRYVAKHLDELIEFDANIVNMDGLETPDGFLIIEYEPTTRTWHSREVVNKLLKASKDNGITATIFGSGKLEKTVGRLSGGSDAAAFSKSSIKAGFINSANWKNRSNYYHQEGDTPDKIREGTLENALKICISYIINEKNSEK